MRMADGDDGQRADRRSRSGAREKLRRQRAHKGIGGGFAGVCRVGKGERHVRQAASSDAHPVFAAAGSLSAVESNTDMVAHAEGGEPLSSHGIARSIDQKT
jgi:hypothetical protein